MVLHYVLAIYCVSDNSYFNELNAYDRELEEERCWRGVGSSTNTVLIEARATTASVMQPWCDTTYLGMPQHAGCDELIWKTFGMMGRICRGVLTLLQMVKSESVYNYLKIWKHVHLSSAVTGISAPTNLKAIWKFQIFRCPAGSCPVTADDRCSFRVFRSLSDEFITSGMLQHAQIGSIASRRL